MFKEAFVANGKKITDRSSLAQYLRRNFGKSLQLIEDNSLLLFFEREDIELYKRIISSTKEFEKKENILTMAIYLIDNNAGINTLNFHFKTNFDIANVMKKNYPNVVPDIKTLFNDDVLSQIFYNEYQVKFDQRYKRNYTFMLHIYENRMYDFTYYYYLYLHLEKNEVIRFTLDGVKMTNLSEITVYLSKNIDRGSLIVDEILQNPFILALMAVKSGIDQVAAILASGRKLEILKCLSSYNDVVDLTPIIRRKMCYWLLFNYKYYKFETDEAKILSNEYRKISQDISLSTISDYVEIYDMVSLLYERFVVLFDHNKIVKYHKGISADDDYYLNHRFNEEYVCKKFLVDNNLYNPVVHTYLHNDTVEREILINVLEKEKAEAVCYKEKVTSITNSISYKTNELNSNFFVSFIFFLLTSVSIVGALLSVNNYTSNIDKYIYFGLVGLLGLSAILFFIALVIYNCKLKNAYIVKGAIKKCNKYLKDLEQEEKAILNAKSKNNFKIIKNLNFSRKNRDKTLKKLSKLSPNKTKSNNGFISFAISLALLPILELGLSFVLSYFNIVVFGIHISNFKINLINLILTAINILILVLFKKKYVGQYFVFVSILLITLLSVLM